MDIGIVSIRYAKALLQFAMENHEEDGVYREMSAMADVFMKLPALQKALLLALHLGVVMALFATLPYGKFAHGIFRTASLLRYAVEKRQPGTLALGDD